MSGPNDNDGNDGDRPNEGAPDVGVGSARWMHETREKHVVASAIGGFIGGLFGRALGQSTNAYWDARGDLRITAGGGLTVTIGRQHADHIANVIRSRSPSGWYHLWSSDLDLPTPPKGDDRQ